MKRRSFLRTMGVVPFIPYLPKTKPVIEFDKLMTNFCMYRLRQHQFWNIIDHIGKDGILSMYIKNGGSWHRYYFDIEICQPNMEIVNNIRDKDLDLRYAFFHNDFRPSTLEFNTLVKYKDSYINQIRLINLQIELHTDSPMLEAGRS